jgi:hypothetical protein
MCNLHQKSLNFSMLLRSLLLVAGCFCVITCGACTKSFHEKMGMPKLAVIWGSGQALTSCRQVLVADTSGHSNGIFQNASLGLEDGDFEVLANNSFRKVNHLFSLGIRPYPVISPISRHGGIEHLPYYLLYKKPKLYISI